jgi:hypothetical protein
MEVLIATLREWHSYNKVSRQKRSVSSVEVNQFAEPVNTGVVMEATSITGITSTTCNVEALASSMETFHCLL